MKKGIFAILLLIVLLTSRGQTVQSGFLPADVFTPTGAPPSTATPTRTPEPAASTATQTIASTPGCQNSLKYYTTAYLSGHTIQLTFDTPFDLNYYRVLDPNGQRSVSLNLPGLKVYVNGVERSDYRVELSDLDHPKRLYIRISGKTGDKVSVELADGADVFCSGTVYVPERWVPTPSHTKRHQSTLLPTIRPTAEP